MAVDISCSNVLSVYLCRFQLHLLFTFAATMIMVNKDYQFLVSNNYLITFFVCCFIVTFSTACDLFISVMFFSFVFCVIFLVCHEPEINPISAIVARGLAALCSFGCFLSFEIYLSKQ